MKKEVRSYSLGVVVAGMVFAFLIGGLGGYVFKDNFSIFAPYVGIKTDTEVNWGKLERVYQALREDFDGSLDSDKLLEGAKRGLVDAAGDPHTIYFSRLEAKQFMDELNGNVGAGVGVELGVRDGFVKVLRTTPDNPAREAGVLAGDIFYKIDGVDISGLSADEVAQKVRGEVGTEVTITFVRDNKEIEFTLKRERINNVSAYVEYKDNVAIVTLRRFDSETGALMRKIAAEIVEKGIDKIVLDLRGNTGGEVTAARDTISLWVDGKLALEQRSRAGYDEKVYANVGQAKLAGKETIILVNGATASASEIVAGALQEYGQARLVGEKTYGKGSVQRLRELDGGEMLKVTIARWYTPKGRNIDGEGIEPDEVVERTFDDVNHERDPQLDRAFELLK
jgi:carboxyl-terminal processing protease